MSQHPSPAPARTDSPSLGHRRQATRLILVRHAEVETAYQRVFGGRIDMELSPEGRQQAGQLAAYLNQVQLDAIYASPMKRVQETLAPILANQQARPVVLADLREVDFGAWTGFTWEQVRDRFRVSAFDWLSLLEQGAIPEAESGAQLRARIGPCLDRILREAQGRTAAVFCHGGVARVLLALLLDLPLPKMAGFDIDYASVSVVERHAHKTEVQLLNYTPWNGQLHPQP